MLTLRMAPFALAVGHVQPKYHEWVAEFGMNMVGEEFRAKFEENVKIIDALNAKDPRATYRVNQFSGMTFEEFAAVYLRLKRSPVAAADYPELKLDSVVAAQDVDWDVTPVKDQGQCGSCWTFGVMGAIEGMNKVQTGQEVILSEQQLVDCASHHDGCDGGMTDSAYEYLVGKDIWTLDSYPYLSGSSGHGNACGSGTPSGLTISGYFTVPGAGSGSQGDDALAKALMNGPVTVTVAVDNQFANYHGGVMSGVPTDCTLNHAILATGYGSDFWKIKNSWGTSYGEGGYAKFERSRRGCGPFGIFFQDAGFQPETNSPSPPSPSPPSPSPGPTWYRTITPAENTGLCVDMPGGNAFNGANIWLWECNGMESQRWVFDSWQLRYGADESMCIDSGDMGLGNWMYIWECNGQPQQTWAFDGDAQRVYLADSSVCLDYYESWAWNGQPLHIWECNDMGNQQWQLWNVDSSDEILSV